MADTDLMKEFGAEDDLNHGLDYLRVKGVSKCNEDSDAFFKNLQESKLGTIQGVIDDINELIKQREELTKALLRDLEQMKIEINSVLIQNQDHDRLNVELVRERLELKKKLADLEEAKVNEKVNCWRDIALLKKELRETIKEYKESKSNMDLIDQALGE